jgi:anti-anti-sigma factor
MTLARVTVEPRGPATVARVHGEIDMSNADGLRLEILEGVAHDGAGLVLDLTETTYLDSSGVRLLFDIAERLQSRRQRLALVVTEAALVRRVLVLTKLDDAVPLHDCVDTALSDLGA